MRPMSTGELGDFAMRVYQSLGIPILRLTAIPSLFTFAGIAFVLWVFLPMLSVTQDPDSIATQVGEAATVLLLALGVAAPVSLFGFAFSSGVIVKLISDYVLGSVPDAAAAIRTGREASKRMVGLLLYGMLIACSGILASTGLLLLSAWLDSVSSDNGATAGVVAVLGVMGYIFGTLLFLVVVSRYVLAPAAVVLENRRSRDAARRSVELLRSNRAQPNGYSAVAMLYFQVLVVGLILAPSIGILMGLVDLESGAAAFSGAPILGPALLFLLKMLPLYLFIWVTVPVWCATTTLMYYERRIRLEGYDIDLLARDMARSRKETRFEL